MKETLRNRLLQITWVKRVDVMPFTFCNRPMRNYIIIVKGKMNDKRGDGLTRIIRDELKEVPAYDLGYTGSTGLTFCHFTDYEKN